MCRLFYTTVMEAWLPAYRRVVTFKAPIATLSQVSSLLSICCKILRKGDCCGLAALPHPQLLLVPPGGFLPSDAHHDHHLLCPLGLLLVMLSRGSVRKGNLNSGSTSTRTWPTRSSPTGLAGKKVLISPPTLQRLLASERPPNQERL